MLAIIQLSMTVLSIPISVMCTHFLRLLLATLRFRWGGLTNEATVELLVFNALGETVVEDTYCRNGDEYTIENVNFGTYYEIQVRYGSGPSKYELTIN